jgi:hypothetical protein
MATANILKETKSAELKSCVGKRTDTIIEISSDHDLAFPKWISWPIEKHSSKGCDIYHSENGHAAVVSKGQRATWARKRPKGT